MKKIVLFISPAALIVFIYLALELTYYRDKQPFISPLDADEVCLRNDEYGDGYFAAPRKNSRTHKGVDMLASFGAPVRAAKGGWAVASFDETGYGNCVKIYHGTDLMTLYAHLSAPSFKWIRKVRQGDIIGWVGKSGNAGYEGIETHLHFEVKECGIPVDPMKGYLK